MWSDTTQLLDAGGAPCQPPCLLHLYGKDLWGHAVVSTANCIKSCQARPDQAKRRLSRCAPVVHKDCAVLAKDAVDVQQVADVGCVEAQAL